MALKGSIIQDHIQRNNFQLKVQQIPIGFNIISVGSLEQELSAVTLPDRRAATGGVTEPLQVDVVTPMHHVPEQAAWEIWFALSKRPQITVASYKFNATLLCWASTQNEFQVLAGESPRFAYELTGVFPVKRASTEFDMTNEGEDARVTWTISIDQIIPVPIEASTVGVISTGVSIVDAFIELGL